MKSLKQLLKEKHTSEPFTDKQVLLITEEFLREFKATLPPAIDSEFSSGEHSAVNQLHNWIRWNRTDVSPAENTFSPKESGSKGRD